MWWRLELFLKGLAKRLVRGGQGGVAAPEIVLLHQAFLRLERRIEILEANKSAICIDEKQKTSDMK
ncbi:MAG: hypothetical protein JWP25_2070 [Bradyrhizobium sp.]|jgi:hypothetical protein|nr:hypothetical protein [Bradyrhizobium sp.]